MLHGPLAIFEQGFQPMDHVGYPMFRRLPRHPAFGTEPLESDHTPVELALREAGNLKHDSAAILSESHVQKELHRCLLRILEPLICPLEERLTHVDLLVGILIVIRVLGLLVLCPPIVLCLNFMSL